MSISAYLCGGWREAALKGREEGSPRLSGGIGHASNDPVGSDKAEGKHAAHDEKVNQELIHFGVFCEGFREERLRGACEDLIVIYEIWVRERRASG